MAGNVHNPISNLPWSQALRGPEDEYRDDRGGGKIDVYPFATNEGKVEREGHRIDNEYDGDEKYNQGGDSRPRESHGGWTLAGRSSGLLAV